MHTLTQCTHTALKKALPAVTRTDIMLKEMLVSLHSEGYLSRQMVKSQSGGAYSHTWEVHELTQKGKDWLARDVSRRDSIMLPMPQVMIDARKAAEQRKEQNIAALVSAGVNMDQVPAEELQEGAGDVMTVLTMWVAQIQRLRSSESSTQRERADLLEAALKEVQNWRDAKARELKIAPAAVLPDFLAMKIIHARATDVEALVAAGVRIKGVEELAALMIAKLPPAFTATSAAGASDGSTMLLPEGIFTPTKAWMHAVYKVAKNGKLPAWEPSYQSFSNGVHPQAIAVNQESGKPIQAATVVG